MEKIAQGEFDAVRLLRYVDDIPMLAASLSRNSSSNKDQKDVNKTVQPSIKGPRGPRMPKPKEVEKQAAGTWKDRINDQLSTNEKRHMLKNLMRKAIEQDPSKANILAPIINKDLLTITDDEKRKIFNGIKEVDLYTKPGKVKDWSLGGVTMADKPLENKIEFPVPKATEKAPQAIAKAKLPSWLKALGVLGGAGLAGYAGYKIYKANQKNKMEKKAGFVTDFLVSKLLKRKERLDNKKIRKQGSFVRAKLRET